ncbi:hypothetical protein SLA2020_257350 [Shorea laevis]
MHGGPVSTMVGGRWMSSEGGIGCLGLTMGDIGEQWIRRRWQQEGEAGKGLAGAEERSSHGNVGCRGNG